MAVHRQRYANNAQYLQSVMIRFMLLSDTSLTERSMTPGEREREREREREGVNGTGVGWRGERERRCMCVCVGGGGVKK